MTEPPRWTDEQLVEHLARSVDIFRRERMEEPLEVYTEFFDEYQTCFEELLEKTVDLSRLEANALDILTNASLLGPLRYLAGPPISADDLKTVADASLAASKLRDDPEMVDRIVEVILLGLDSRRFPWVREGRDPTEAEKTAAIVASAALMATSKVGTRRRTEGSTTQEAAVQQELRNIGFVEVPTRTMNTQSDFPKPGEFCGESMLGTTKADVTVGLYDNRVMAVECKVSNSQVNSIKRLNRDAAAKAGVWRDEFGRRSVVPAAVLSGVYGLAHLKDAQDRGLTLFWSHDLSKMVQFVLQTKELA